MNTDKTFIQSVSRQMELLLKDYKNQYPKNTGALIRNGFPFMLLIVAAVVLPVTTAVYVATTADFAVFLAMFFIIPVFFVFSIILIFKNKREKITDKQLPQKIESARKKLEAYNKYSDVSKYIEGYNNQIAKTDNAKKQYRSTFRTIFAVFFCLAAFYTVERIIWMRNFDSCTNHSFNGDTEILCLEKNTPFLVLKPLKTDIYGNCKVSDSGIEIFYQEDYLVLKEINISGSDSADIFRLIITDNNGNRIANSPKFIFKADKTEKIDSEDFCQKKMQSEDGYSSNSFKAFETCRYLNNHKDKLGFVVEKIN